MQIILSGDRLEGIQRRPASYNQQFFCWDEGDVFVFSDVEQQESTCAGTIYIAPGSQLPDVTQVGKPFDQVRVLLPAGGLQDRSRLKIDPVEGYVLRKAKWVKASVQIVPTKELLFSRSEGLLETDLLSGCKVLKIGLGSVGSEVVALLAQSGIMNFFLMDHDRLEMPNIARHRASRKHLGRFKTKFCRDDILGINHYACIHCEQEAVGFDNTERVRDLVRQSDVVVCTADQRLGKLITNRICVEEKKPLIIGGCSRRASGGQILVIKPGETLCYQCFLQSLPERNTGESVSHFEERGSHTQYSDRPVPIEPGLSIDILPISNMIAKLTLQQLLKGKKTTLSNLDEDLQASWYFWLNRREPGTDFEKWEPLEFNIDGMHILRWYGVSAEKDPGYPVCGDFAGQLAKQAQIDVDPDEIVRLREGL